MVRVSALGSFGNCGMCIEASAFHGGDSLYTEQIGQCFMYIISKLMLILYLRNSDTYTLIAYHVRIRRSFSLWLALHVGLKLVVFSTLPDTVQIYMHCNAE